MTGVCSVTRPCAHCRGRKERDIALGNAAEHAEGMTVPFDGMYAHYFVEELTRQGYQIVPLPEPAPDTSWMHTTGGGSRKRRKLQDRLDDARYQLRKNEWHMYPSEIRKLRDKIERLERQLGETP